MELSDQTDFFKYQSKKQGIKCALWSFTWQWREHLHLTAGCNDLIQRYIDSMEHRLCEPSSFQQYSSENKENLSPKISRSTLRAHSWNGSSCTLEENRDLVACKMDVWNIQLKSKPEHWQRGEYWTNSGRSRACMVSVSMHQVGMQM